MTEKKSSTHHLTTRAMLNLHPDSPLTLVGEGANEAELLDFAYPVFVGVDK